ncbi:MAG: peptidase M14 [Bacteroidetes bacterium]|nr:peptidase M14 [Bacteroidota bacterium]
MIKHLILFIAILSELIMAQDIEFANNLYFKYQNYKEQTLISRRFKLSDILPLIDRLKDKNIFSVNKVGESSQKRPIFLITAGKGKTKIFLWSQMHGDESTATGAIFDIFNFLTGNDEFNDFRNELLNKATIYFMPMVNPDGAEVFQRRNNFEIDINRDAVSQQTPEGRVLKETFDSLKANFGFNLHDQSILYSAGHTFKSAVLSFLAPAENFEKTISEVRSNAMKLIGHLNNVLSNLIPGHLAKYSDDFEPRAFGDNFQKWGTSTILIESGGWKNDPEKQFIRKLNFIALLSAFKSIADKSYKSEPLETYENIPFNEEDLMNLVIRNVLFKKNGTEYKVDIGITRTEINCNGSNDFYYKSAIEDIGDLSTFFGYEDYNFDGMEISLGKTFPQKFYSISEIESLNFKQLYEDGYTNVFIDSSSFNENFTTLPINITHKIEKDSGNNLKIDDIPNFIIKKNGHVKYSVINGFLIDVESIPSKFMNGVILE